MSEIVARQRPPIDLDDFQRRMRAPRQPQCPEEDPLAELARLVGEQHDPYGDVFAQEATARHAQNDVENPLGRREPAFEGVAPRFSADFAAIEAGLRGTHSPHLEPAEANTANYSDGSGDQGGHSYAGQGNEDWLRQGRSTSQPAMHSRRPVYAMAATIVVCMIGIGFAFAYKGRASSPSEIKTITAASGPTKVQPPADATPDQADQDGAAPGQAAPTKLVSRDEQPIDLSQAVQENASRDAASRGTDAASVPVPLSPGQAQDAAAGTVSPDYSATGSTTSSVPDAGASNPTYSDRGFGAGMPAPKKVKVVSVRPDGTILPNDQLPAAAMPQAAAAPPHDAIAKAIERAGPVARASSPKSTSRVSTTPKPTDIASAGGDADTPAPVPAKPAKAPRKAKPVHVASADTGEHEATEAAAPAAATSGGMFAVQLAAPGSESDARSTTARLLKKYSGALSGRRLGFHRAESNGRSVYRVRVSSMSKDDATSLCDKLKAAGGTCFVAKN